MCWQQTSTTLSPYMYTVPLLKDLVPNITAQFNMLEEMIHCRISSHVKLKKPIQIDLYGDIVPM